MQRRESSVRAALALLGLAEGADRAAVTHAFRRLARATHPDLSDAPDAEARFAAVYAAYRRALVDVEDAVPERPASSAVRITVHHSREDRFLRPAAVTFPVGHPGPVVAVPHLIDRPIVAGPVRVVSPSVHPWRDAAPYRGERHGRPG